MPDTRTAWGRLVNLTAAAQAYRSAGRGETAGQLLAERSEQLDQLSPHQMRSLVVHALTQVAPAWQLCTACRGRVGSGQMCRDCSPPAVGVVPC